MEQILPTDSVILMATKMFFDYQVGQSATVSGFIEMPDDSTVAKGELVLEEIRRLDLVENFTDGFRGKGSRGKNIQRRKRKRMPENTIGDYLCQKTFKWKKNIINNQVRYTIWRIQ